MIIFEVMKYKARKLATSHFTQSICSGPAEIGVFTSVEKYLQSHFSEHWRVIDTARKCLVHYSIEVSVMAIPSNTENILYNIQQKVKKEQLTVMDMWRK